MKKDCFKLSFKPFLSYFLQYELIRLTTSKFYSLYRHIDSHRIVRFDSGREQDIENWSQQFSITDLHDKIRTLV